MSVHQPFFLAGSDGKHIRGDHAVGQGRQILFITGFLSKRWGNKSKALAQWCHEQGWGFCCYDVRGFGDSEGQFTEYTLSDWIADAQTVLDSIKSGPPVTIVGNSLGSWIAWLVAQESSMVDELLLIAPAFNMMGKRAKSISKERLHYWHTAGWMPWNDDPLHRDWPLSWRWVEESEWYWARTFDVVRHVKTTILHGLHDTVIAPEGSQQFTDELRRRVPTIPLDLQLIQGDHRLSSPEHLELFRRLVMREI
ncbi:MAG: alpha/beta hydrolase [Nitrospira sp.]|nr:alpha/beta hydrolase [Nitrospira sp.]